MRFKMRKRKAFHAWTSASSVETLPSYRPSGTIYLLPNFESHVPPSLTHEIPHTPNHPNCTSLYRPYLPYSFSFGPRRQATCSIWKRHGLFLGNRDSTLAGDDRRLPEDLP